MISISTIKQFVATILSIFSLKYIVDDKIYELTKRLREIGLEEKALDLEQKANELIHIHSQILILERALFILMIAFLLLIFLNYRVLGNLFLLNIIKPMRRQFQKLKSKK